MIKTLLKRLYFATANLALDSANRQAGRNQLIETLKNIVPDLSEQYTTWKIENQESFDAKKIRSIHAFQVDLVLSSLDAIVKSNKSEKFTIVDIGDSAGSHARYLSKLSKSLGRELRILSVNIDQDAVDRIKKSGGQAIRAKAEEVHKSEELYQHVDMFISFQMLEHLLNPALFMHNIAEQTNTNHFVITVPYVRTSRVGLKYLRRPDHVTKFGVINAENTHIFELSPEDWKLLLRFSGWRVAQERKFLMYPEKSLLYFFRFLLRRFDFEGFLGLVLERDMSDSLVYQDW